jgi:hypothetical protein
MLEKLLKEYLADDSKVSEFLEKMKKSKIFLSKEENIDTRYTKMKGEYEAEKAEYAKALKLIETLKAQTQGQDALQTQIANYEQEISDLKANNKQLTRENNLKVALLSGKAKAEDIDYLLFKLSKDENAVKYGENGEVSNVNEIIDNLKKAYPSHFENGAKKVVEKIDLPNDGDKDVKITKEQFDKMNYNQKNELFHKNEELFNKLANGEEGE